ncbi:type IV secretory system conjugative DNA transfer family protein [Rhodoplanes elegans]|uniref:type IV secretory system conjugative DNA transfer family protein n=1 Tax=Rhodoplanes elegans TaxID=29408 RepID=UPI0011B93A05|nr:type IV secretion system DNA-binding domain-containing protein [Rhodoplanes elegans]
MKSDHPVYTPFLRRFTDEAARDLAGTIELYRRVQATYQASVFSQSDAAERFHSIVIDGVGKVVSLPSSPAIGQALERCQRAIIVDEEVIFSFPDIDWPNARLSMKEQTDLARFLRAKEHFLANQDKVIEKLYLVLGNLIAGIIKDLPPLPAAKASFLVPLVVLLPEPGALIAALTNALADPAIGDAGILTKLRNQLADNVWAASGIPPGTEPKKPLLTADDSDLSPEELAQTYLNGTPLLDLFLTPVPFVIPERVRMEHTHIIGGSGHGKTQLLQHLILSDLRGDTQPALIVIDSQGEMLNTIHTRDFGSAITDRVVLIDPEDIEHPPALNMFDAANGRLSGYSRLHREQIEASVIELYNYIFAAIAAEMTSRQSTAFAFVTRLILSVEGATIHTLRELMEESAATIQQSRFEPHIRRLDRTSQAYFENQFFTKKYADLKQQIARRLYSVLSVPSFDRMFSSKVNKLDMFEAIQNRRIVLINTSKSLLKSDASALFGRYAIALAIRAAFERVATPERPPCYLIIDEAQEYFDENIQTLLEQARKMNVGVVLAHQHLDQLTPALRSSIAANTSIKLAGGISDRDARALAPDMNSTGDFIRSMHKKPRSTEFACYVRNHTSCAIRLEVPFGTLEAQPRLTAHRHADLIASIRARYAYRADELPVTRETPEALAATAEASDSKPAAPEPAPASESAKAPDASVGKW